MGFFCQCEKKHNYFVHGLIRLQVHASTCMHHRAVTDQHIFACNIYKSYMNGCASKHAYTHLAFKGENITYSAFSAYSSVTVTLRGMWVLLLVNVTTY